MSDASKPAIIIRRWSDGSEEHRVELNTPGTRHAVKVAEGLWNRIDTARFYLDTSEATS